MSLGLRTFFFGGAGRIWTFDFRVSAPRAQNLPLISLEAFLDLLELLGRYLAAGEAFRGYREGSSMPASTEPRGPGYQHVSSAGDGDPEDPRP